MSKYQIIDYPEEVTVNHIRYTIKPRVVDGRYTQSDRIRTTIYFDCEASPERQRSSLFHEMIALMLDDGGVSFIEDKVLRQILCNNLYPLFRINDFSFAYKSITEEEEVFPGFFDVLGVSYDIVQREMDNQYGNCDYQGVKISIHEDLPYDMKCKSLLHELIHAFLYESGYDKHGDEPLVRRLENDLYDLVRENDFDWLFLHHGNEAGLREKSPSNKNPAYPYEPFFPEAVGQVKNVEQEVDGSINFQVTPNSSFVRQMQELGRDTTLRPWESPATHKPESSSPMADYVRDRIEQVHLDKFDVMAGPFELFNVSQNGTGYRVWLGEGGPEATFPNPEVERQVNETEDDDELREGAD